MSVDIDIIPPVVKDPNGEIKADWRETVYNNGTVILGKVIARTQYGMVVDVEGETIGYYDKLQEFGGENNKEQSIIVYA